MNAFASFEVTTRADYQLSLLSLAIAYLVLYPAWVTYKRHRFQRRISQRTVTSMYKPPLGMTPAEIAYVFSTKIGTRHIFATLLDLANRGVITLVENQEIVYAKIGPKVVSDLKPFEKLLVDQIHAADDEISVQNLKEGFTQYVLSSGEKVRGSRGYVFWWLLRQSLRNDAVIFSKMIPRYAKLLFYMGVAASLPVVLIPLLSIRLLQMVNSGEIIINDIVANGVNGLMLWALMIGPTLVISFFVLRFAGVMLGRHWMLTPKYLRYLEQLDAYRAFVRLTHKRKLKFESKELAEESRITTKPYAVAMGYTKPD